ncbi:hypothetical protein ACXFFP_002316, partial [Escherichia coli]
FPKSSSIAITASDIHPLAVFAACSANVSALGNLAQVVFMFLLRLVTCDFLQVFFTQPFFTGKRLSNLKNIKIILLLNLLNLLEK